MTTQPSKIVAIKDADRTPEIVLHQVMETVEDVAGLVLVRIDHDSRMLVDWSQMSLADLCLLSEYLGLVKQGLLATMVQNLETEGDADDRPRPEGA